MSVGNNLIADGQAHAGALANGFGSEEGIKDAIAQIISNAPAVVDDANLNGLIVNLAGL